MYLSSELHWICLWVENSSKFNSAFWKLSGIYDFFLLFQIGHPNQEHQPVSQSAIYKIGILLLAPCVEVIGKETSFLKHCRALIMSIPEIHCLVTVNMF